MIIFNYNYINYYHINNYYTILLILFIIAATIIIFFTIKPIYESFSDKKTFSNTQEWGSEKYNFLQKLTPLGKKIIDSIPYRPFPPNNSTETKLEIQNIKDKMKNLQQKKYLNTFLMIIIHYFRV